MSEDGTLTPKRRRIPWSLMITLALALILLVLAFSGVDWEEMLVTVRQGQPLHLLLAFVFMSTAYFLRGLRWRTLLSAEKPLNPFTVFWGTCVGYLGNAFLPARAGEVIRSVLIGMRTGINTLFVFATALTERIFDAALLVLIVVVLLPIFDAVPDWLLDARQVMLLIGFGGLAGLLLAPLLEPMILRILSLIVPTSIEPMLRGAAEKFILGLRAFQTPLRAGLFIGITLLTWSVDVLVGLQMAAAFGLELSPEQVLFLLAALGLSSAVPSTPGYVGVYQFVAVTVLGPFGVAQEAALVYILAFQAVTYAVVIVWGGLGLWRLNVNPRDLKRLRSAAPSAEDITS